MKHTKEFLYTSLLTFSLLLSGCTPSNVPNNLETEVIETEVESEILGELLSSETEMESEVISTETEIESEPIETPLSYNEQIGLDFVETPTKRNREQAIEKMKELSRWYPALYFVYQNADSYPIELLLSGAGNPEMADFLYGYLTSDGTAAGVFTDEEQPENYPLFLQFDPRWGYLPYGSGGNVGSSGCGPTCLSMAIFYLTGDRSCTPDAIAQFSLEHGYYLDGIGTKWSLLADYPKRYGLSSYQLSWTEANIRSQLDKGRVLICSVRPGDFTTAGHFIVIYGYDENGFKINDPKSVYRSGLSWTYSQIQDDIKAMWTIGK